MVVGFITFPDDESHINRHSNSSIQRGNDFGQPITTIAANAKKGEGITSSRVFPRPDHPARRAAQGRQENGDPERSRTAARA